MHVNMASREVSCKLVYCGPGLSGKTTNLERIHAKAPRTRRGDLVSVATSGDRTLFFDYLPLDLGTVGGAATRFQLYTVPGQAYYAATRKMVLKGADGLVFVADSDPQRLEENLESLDELRGFVREILGRELQDLPFVFQWNKRDLPNALPLAELERHLNPTRRAAVAAIAREGRGVLATLKELSRQVLAEGPLSPSEEVTRPQGVSRRGRAAESSFHTEPLPSAPAPEPPVPVEPPPPPPPLPGSPAPLGAESDPVIGQVAGGCRIHTKLAEGGMGAVYLARHELMGKSFVVKLLKPEAAHNERRVRRFFREARLAAKLEHPGIVAVQDVGTNEAGLHYIVMQYVAGQNLHQRIQARGAHDPPTATRIILRVASALERLHEAGIIHRDVKADNVVITPRGDVKLVDFGLAKDLSEQGNLTLPGALIGTPVYMAPEIGRVRAIDGRADLYSLGLTFYYLLTGEPPFSGASLHDVVYGRVKLPSPREFVPDLSEEACAILAKLLAWHRDERYPDAGSLVRDLRALLGGKRVSALSSPAPWQRTAPPPDPIPPTIPPDRPSTSRKLPAVRPTPAPPADASSDDGSWEDSAVREARLVRRVLQDSLRQRQRARLTEYALAATLALLLLVTLALRSAWERAESVADQAARLESLLLQAEERRPLRGGGAGQ